jgi:hypothetical protein
MIVFWILVCALLVVGTATARSLWKTLDGDGGGPEPLALAAAGSLIGVAIWLGINWVLALTHLLTRFALWSCTAAVVLIAAAILVRHGRSLARFEVPPEAKPVLLALAPLFLWLMFILWRGTVLPPDNHDVLSYHLPRALMMARADGYSHVAGPDARLTSYPVNYELLLADVLILAGDDQLTEWIGAVMYLALLLVTAAIARRWWEANAAAVVAAVLATASAPVLLLHSGADKNDLMVIWLATCALFWGARWVTAGGRMPMLLTVLALGLAAGTKATAAAVGFALAPFLVYRAVREIRKGSIGLRDAGLTAAAAIATFLLGGGVTYIVNFTSAGGQVAAATTDAMKINYGDWSNLWQVPYLLFTVPFGDDYSVWLPWRGEWWFWPRYEIFFSHYGRLFTCLLLLIPFVAVRWRRAGAGTERLVASIAAAIMLPAQFRPFGFFGAFARYIGFIVPLIACWSLPPLVRAASAYSRRFAALILLALAVVFTVEAVECAVNDRFSPLEYALMAKELPRTRVIWFSNGRAGSVVDTMAGPHDKIAVDGSFDTWLWPAYGRNLTRELVFVPPGATPDSIPPDVKWVIVDRSWNAIWNHPALTDLGKMREYAGKGTPSADDVRLYNALVRDRRFHLVYHMAPVNQAVFKRVGTTTR